jgi:hypothetical protein
MFANCTSFTQSLFWKIPETTNTTDMFRNCGISDLNEILPSELHTIAEPILVPYMNEVDPITLDEPLKTKESYNEYFSDQNNILLMIVGTGAPKYIFLARDSLNHSMDMDDEQNGIVFLCNGEYPTTYNITKHILIDFIPYFNLRKIGGYGYTRASQIQFILGDHNQFYVLSQVDTAISAASWGMYMLGIANASSGTHCQEGTGGAIYDIQIAKIEKPTSRRSRKRKRSSRPTRSRSRKRQTQAL